LGVYKLFFSRTTEPENLIFKWKISDLM
jgi:hypothetical protein